ncbi:nucleotidyltransferase domain-containing protein [Candidatus Pacearchaeota archaeon]|nr:nucleotidyltransferase domain-containing protein [Candidatus Pacearchaeota archaeon]
MENEIIKNTIKVGNSAGVLLPKEWLNTQVKVILQPLNIKKEVLEILIEENLLKNLLGAYITGSYARNEQTIESDVDILAITDSINKKIKKGRYEIILVSKENAEKQLKTNILPLLPMIKEAEVIINDALIKGYLNTSLTKKNLKWYVDTTKSRIKKIKEDISLYKKAGENYMSDNVAYILILRLRSLYILSCMKKDEAWRKIVFLRLVRRISGSLKAYEGYLRSKNNERVRNELLVEEAEKIADYADKEVIKLKKWLRERKD